MSTGKSNRRNRSVIWDFFTPDKKSPDMAICNICKHKFSFKTSTSNLKRHMLSKHPSVSIKYTATDPRYHLQSSSQQDCDEEMNDETLDQRIGSSSSTDTPMEVPQTSSQQASEVTDNNNPPLVQGLNNRNRNQLAISSFISKKIPMSRKKHIEDNLLKIFTLDFQPFSVVEDNGFRQFVKALNPSYELPSRQHISKTLIPARFEVCLNSTKEKLSNAVSVCLTTDCWTSINTDSFMGVTAHFIDSNFSLNSVLLQCAQFSGRHTSQNLADELKKVQTDWNLENKIQITVSDNASNIKKAIKEILRWKHFGCFAHSLNLIVNGSMEDNTVVLDLVLKVRGIVSHFKRSTTSTEKLLAYQANNTAEKTQLKLVQDVSTRWNSTYYMLKRFTDLEETVKATVALIDKDVTQLSTIEWKMAHELVSLLKPFESVTKHISGEKYATASLVIPLSLGLQDVCKKLLQRNYMAPVNALAKSLSQGVSDRFGMYEHSNTLTVATFLDPRYKNCVFSAENIKEDVKKKVIALVAGKMDNISIPSSSHLALQNEHAPSAEDDDLDVFNYASRCVAKHKPSGTKQSRAIIEVNRYLDEDILPKGCDPLQWWSDNRSDYPLLSKVVREHFCVLCTSVPCERVFSKAGNLLSERRNRLSGKKAQQLMFLNYNE